MALVWVFDWCYGLSGAGSGSRSRRGQVNDVPSLLSTRLVRPARHLREGACANAVLAGWYFWNRPKQIVWPRDACDLTRSTLACWLTGATGPTRPSGHSGWHGMAWHVLCMVVSRARVAWSVMVGRGDDVSAWEGRLIAWRLNTGAQSPGNRGGGGRRRRGPGPGLGLLALLVLVLVLVRGVPRGSRQRQRQRQRQQQQQRVSRTLETNAG